MNTTYPDFHGMCFKYTKIIRIQMFFLIYVFHLLYTQSYVPEKYNFQENQIFFEFVHLKTWSPGTLEHLLLLSATTSHKNNIMKLFLTANNIMKLFTVDLPMDMNP